MPTIFDIAKKANVSVMTVSRVLNKPTKVSPKTIQKIHLIMDNLGFQPSHIARSLVKKKTNSIGILMPDIKNTFFNSWFRSVDDYAQRFGYNSLLCNTDEDSDNEMKFIRLFHAQRVDGILIVPHSRESVNYLIKSNMKFILVDRMYEAINTDFVITDHYAGACKASEYLISLGHRKIGILKGPGFLFPDVERYRGFCSVMKKYNIEINQAFIKNCKFEEALAYDAVKNLLQQQDRPTAVFSFNSLMTIGAIKAINSLNLTIPADISLVSFDEIPGQEIFKPKITYILQPIEDLGRNATKFLLEKIENPDSKKRYRVFLKPKLITGDSCRRIN
jgi:LacI family transcriptional regulator